MRRTFILLSLHLLAISSVSAQSGPDNRLSYDPVEATLSADLRIQAADTVSGRSLIVWGTRARSVNGEVVPTLVYTLDSLPTRLTNDVDRPGGFVGILPLNKSFMVIWNDSRGGIRGRTIDLETGRRGETVTLATDVHALAGSVVRSIPISDDRYHILWIDSSKATRTWVLDAEQMTVVDARTLSNQTASLSSAVVWFDGRLVFRIGDTTGIFVSSETIESRWVNWNLVTSRRMQEGDTMIVMTTEGLAFYRSFTDPVPIKVYPGEVTGSSARLIISRDSIGYFVLWSDTYINIGGITGFVNRQRIDSAGILPPEVIGGGSFSWGNGQVTKSNSESSVIQGCGRASRVSYEWHGTIVLTMTGFTTYGGIGFAYVTDSMGRVATRFDPHPPHPSTFTECPAFTRITYPVPPVRTSFETKSSVTWGGRTFTASIEPSSWMSESANPVIVSRNGESVLLWFEKRTNVLGRSTEGFRRLDPNRVVWETSRIPGDAHWRYWGGYVVAEDTTMNRQTGLGGNRESTHTLTLGIRNPLQWTVSVIDTSVMLTPTPVRPSNPFVVRSVGYDPEVKQTHIVYDHTPGHGSAGYRAVVRFDEYGSFVDRVKLPLTLFTSSLPARFGLTFGAEDLIDLHDVGDSVTTINVPFHTAGIYALPQTAADLQPRTTESTHSVMPIGRGRYVRMFIPEADSTVDPISWSVRLEVRCQDGLLLAVRYIPVPSRTDVPFLMSNPAHNSVILLVPGDGVTCHYLDDNLSFFTTAGGTSLSPFRISETTDSVALPTGIVFNDTLFAVWEDYRASVTQEIFGNYWAIPKGLAASVGSSSDFEDERCPYALQGEAFSPVDLISVSPNPLYRSMRLEVESALNQKASITMVGLLGERVTEIPLLLKEGIHSYEFDLHGIASGLYRVVITGTIGTDNESIIVLGE